MKEVADLPIAMDPAVDSNPNVSLYFIGGNLLAAEYVMRLLGEETTDISPVPFDSVVKSLSSATDTVFILDNCCLVPPLGECLRKLRCDFPDGKFLVIDSQQTDTDMIRMLALGVRGVIRHDQVVAMLRQAVSALCEGRIWVENEALQRYVAYTALSGRLSGNDLDIPTFRESQVLELAKERLTNKEMGQMLGVQESTIKFHLSNIYSKLQIGNRLQLFPADRRSRCWSFRATNLAA
ncbi:MAG: response regulator transcription factor [Candidatus Sulfotelmatobacter sp.]